MRNAFLVGLLGCTHLCLAQTVLLPGYKFDVVATGLTRPVSVDFVGVDKMLVLEKNSGKVKKYFSGSYVGDAIDLAVANANERGLLGICLDPNFNGTGNVYLYYSKATTDGGTWTDNRVEKFFYDGSNLTFVQTLITFPFDGGQNNGPNHNGGIITIGPDDKLYICVGDLDRGYVTNGRLEQNYSTTAIAGAGGIVRLNLDGTIPSDNPFFSHPDPRIRAYYCYGVRNPFGITTDPITNKIWFTENGPTVYDEVNIAFSGMNSGWRKIMGPDFRNAAYFENEDRSWDSADLVYLSGAAYADPVFSWLTPIGVTGIEFLNSIQFAATERNDCVVSDINLTNVYIFDLNTARTGFNLKPGTEDGVADSVAERDQYLLGFNFGNVSNIKMGPDGFLYVVGHISNTVYRIRPEDVVYAPATMTKNSGVVLSGSTTSLRESDDQRLVVQHGVVTGNQSPTIELILSATARITSTTNLKFSIESSGSHTGITQKIELLNQQSQVYETVNTRLLGTSDSTALVTVTTNPNRFINSATKQMTARLTYTKAPGIIGGKWSAKLDELLWKVRE